MLLQSVLATAFLALSAVAAPHAKTFKFLVEDPQKGKFYLADASGRGTQDPSKALACELAGAAGDVLKCGGKGFPEFSGDMVKLVPGFGSNQWSIDANNNIHWSAVDDMHFSIRNKDEIWAENCALEHGHFAAHGSAKAVFV